MEFTTTQQGAVTIVAITGSLDALTAPTFGTALNDAIAHGQVRLVVDLANLEYTSSAGLRVLLNAVKEARQHGGDLRLAAMQAGVKKVFDLSGFTSILKSFADVNAAIASFA